MLRFRGNDPIEIIFNRPAGLAVRVHIQVTRDRVSFVIDCGSRRQDVGAAVLLADRYHFHIRGDVPQPIVPYRIWIIAQLGDNPFRRRQQQGVGRENVLVFAVAQANDRFQELNVGA